jgi:hypothetical protein
MAQRAAMMKGWWVAERGTYWHDVYARSAVIEVSRFQQHPASPITTQEHPARSFGNMRRRRRTRCREWR